VNLGEREVRMLEVDFLGTPAVRNHIEGHFDVLGVSVINPSRAALIEPDVGCCWGRGCSIIKNCGEITASFTLRQAASHGHSKPPPPLPHALTIQRFNSGQTFFALFPPGSRIAGW